MFHSSSLRGSYAFKPVFGKHGCLLIKGKGSELKVTGVNMQR